MARYDVCLTRVDVSKSVGVPCEMYGWDVGVTRHARDVVSCTLNKTHEFLAKEKPPTRIAQEGIFYKEV